MSTVEDRVVAALQARAMEADVTPSTLNRNHLELRERLVRERGHRTRLLLAAAASVLLVVGAAAGLWALLDDGSRQAVPAGPGPAESSTAPKDTRLPQSSGPPEALTAGTYLTPIGFAPEMSVTVPDGWYGMGGASGWAVVEGNDSAAQRGGFYVDVVPMPYAEAVAAFQEVEGLDAGAPTETTVDGRPATSFRASVPAGSVVLDDALGIGVDVFAESLQQLFIDADGTTLLVRVELFDQRALPGIETVLASLAFPE